MPLLFKSTVNRELLTHIIPMKLVILSVAAILLALGAVEGVSYWWMHPAPAGLGEPVLVYRPGRVEELSVVSGPLSAGEEELSERSQSTVPKLTTDNRQPTTDNSSSSPTDNRQPTTDNSSNSSSSPTDNGQPTTDNSSNSSTSPSSVTPLPEVVARALPSLRCTTGTAARIDREDDGVTIHVAFFEWDLSSTDNVLEAYRHLPEECMGSIGMKLVSKEKPIAYTVRGQGMEDRLSVVGWRLSAGKEELSVVGDQLSVIGGQSSAGEEELSERSQSTVPKLTTDNRQRTTDNSSSSPTDNRQRTTDNSPSSTLSFDHTIFRDQAGVVIHAFKGTWVSGASNLLGDGLRGGVEQWTQLRWKSALKRFRPAHARVIQGAVRGIRDPDLAWQAFEQAMLKDLSFALQ